MRPRAGWHGLLMGTALVGCAGEAPSRPESATLPEVEAVPVLRVGSRDGPDALTFTARGGAVIAPDSSLYAFFPMEMRIGVFSPQGVRTASLGRRGTGPGELDSGGWVAWSRDTLRILDELRVTSFPGGTEPGLSRVPHRPSGIWGEADNTYPMLVLPDGSIVYSPRTGSGFRPDSVVLSSLDGAGSSPPTPFVPIFVGTRIVVYRDPDGGRGSGVSMSLPFPDADLVAPHTTRPALVVVDRRSRAADGIASVRLVRPDGTVAVSRDVRVASPAPVTDSEWDAMLEERIEILMEAGEPPGSREAARRWIDAAHGRSAFHAAAHALMVTSDGEVWLQEPTAGANAGPRESRWLVLDTELANRRRVTIPAGIEILDVRDGLAWGLEFDEFDVPYLVRMEL